MIKATKNGGKNILYRQICPRCKIDVGYRRNCDANRTCVNCQNQLQRFYSAEHKKIRSSMKANLSARLKQRLINKNKKSTFDLLGYTVDDLKKHIESLWESWMNWENYGIYVKDKRTWNIDHVKPDSWFNYSSVHDPEFKECWSLKNLQPKEAIKNLKKSNNYEG